MIKPLLANQLAYHAMMAATLECGTTLTARGSTFVELENYQLTVHSTYPFMMFASRKYNIDYFKQEMLWKLTGDPFNESIKQHAKMWESVQNSDGSFNSNYGQYWFGEQLGLHKAFNELVADKESRRAVIPMLSTKHVGHGVNDTVCTGHISFRIRKGYLNMSVAMRSSDQIFGLGTDIPTFATLHRMLQAMLSPIYGVLGLGNITITADSSHIYERHIEMCKSIINNNEVLELWYMPTINVDEAFKLAACKGKVNPSWGDFSKWLLETSNG